MANALYDKSRQKFLEGGIAWLTDSIVPVLVDTGAYTPNLATHEFLSDVPSGARIKTGAPLTGKTSTAGVADADDLTLSSVSGPTCEALVLIKDTGSPATSPLIAYIDTASGLPATPTGGNILVQWDNGSLKIFKL